MGKPISKLKHLPIGHIIWLDKCVILDYQPYLTNKIVVINLATGKLRTHNTTDYRLMFIGNSGKQAYFTSRYANSKISGKVIENEGSIISINENGITQILDNIRTRNMYPNDSLYFYYFYNSYFAIRCLELSHRLGSYQPLKTEFITDTNVIYSSDSIYPFLVNDESYVVNGTTYFKINGTEIYKVKNSFPEKIYDFKEDQMNPWIREFKIEGDYLIYKSQEGGFDPEDNTEDSLITANGLVVRNRVYGYNTIGIVNLKTKKCSYPSIRK